MRGAFPANCSVSLVSPEISPVRRASRRGHARPPGRSCPAVGWPRQTVSLVWNTVERQNHEYHDQGRPEGPPRLTQQWEVGQCQSPSTGSGLRSQKRPRQTSEEAQDGDCARSEAVGDCVRPEKKSPRLPRLPRRSGGRGVACRRDDEDGWNWPWDISTARRQCVGCDGVWRLATDGGPPRRVERRWEGRRAWKRSVWWGGISQPLARAKLAETRGTSGMWVLPERIDQWRHTKRNDCAGGPVSGNQTPAEADRQCGYLALPRGAAKAVTSKIELPVWQRRAQKRLAAAFPDPSTRQTGQWREWTSTHSAGCC